VTAEEQAKDAVRAAVDRFGRIDVLVNNAGRGLLGAVEALSESLYAELKPLGVHAMVVEPGYFRTDFLDSSSLHTQRHVIEDYVDGPAGQMRITAGQRNHDQPGDPVKAANAIIDVVESPQPPVRLQLGRDTIAAVEGKIAHVQAELAQWRAVADSTDFVVAK
jgi:NAD(P)-dependent dehydrogenase (short-subunit alcohol dehydrogenase family)